MFFILLKISDTCGLKSGNAAKKRVKVLKKWKVTALVKEGEEIIPQNDLAKYSSCERIMSVQSLDLRY